jgi:hypothetical protein
MFVLRREVKQVLFAERKLIRLKNSMRARHEVFSNVHNSETGYLLTILYFLYVDNLFCFVWIGVTAGMLCVLQSFFLLRVLLQYGILYALVLQHPFVPFCSFMLLLKWQNMSCIGVCSYCVGDIALVGAAFFSVQGFLCLVKMIWESCR